ncbi:efflux RND transporter periplasmic adaptor subunit [Persicobacter psychrovividus]|uniref:RND transporter n=1 Tax=Persicobacter psychrovividus TaxID=387638 RepID=A0ABN6LI12_9BACT|nr:RND transporter [Persicobacter psychrovividus]
MMKFLMGCAAALLMVSCSSKADHTKTATPQVVKALRFGQQPTEERQVYTGVSIPHKSVELSFRVSGPLVGFDLEEGQYVSKGAFLGQIDTRDFKTALRKAEANFNQYKAAWERAERLFQKNNVSQQQYDLARAQFQTASANLKEAEYALKDTRLLAPFSGYVKTVNVEKGQHVNARQTVITFLDLSKVKVRCAIPESLAMNPSEIEQVEVRFEGFEAHPFQATIKEIGRDADHLKYAYPMILEIDRPDASLIGGMAAEVEVYLHAPKDAGVLLPSTAVLGHPNGEQFFWGVKDLQGPLVKVPVKLGAMKNNDWLTVYPEESDCEWAVSAGGIYLHAGQIVRVKKEVRNLSMK